MAIGDAVVWCFYNTENYRDCIFKDVNLGSDTDTVAAIAGGLAGLYYGEFSESWVKILCGKELLDDAVDKLAKLVPDEV